MKRLSEQQARNSAQEIVDASSLREIIEEDIRRECVEIFGNGVHAIVLTGSLARDEASLSCKDGVWRIAGDAEFLVVFEAKATLPTALTVGNVRQRIETSLRSHKIECSIDLSAVRPSYFERLPPHILSYELKHNGQVILGDCRVLHLIPDFSVDDLALEDAWRLLNNRLIEVLEHISELPARSNTPSAPLRYRILKLYLDMATSFLVFAREYAPTYQKRCAALQSLAAKERRTEDYPFDLEDFCDRVSRCTSEKLQLTSAEQCAFTLSWRDALRTAHSLWRWEIVRLVGTEQSLPDRELLEKWVRRLPRLERIRGWSYVLRARAWHRSYLDWPRWLRLCWKASPRYCIYFVGSTLLFRLAEDEELSESMLRNEDFEFLRRLLPVTKATSSGKERASWESLASETFWNYKEFLVGTRS